jgi:hypothetical protein
LARSTLQLIFGAAGIATAHWLSPRGDDPQVSLHQTLLAFHHIRGAHSGQRIAHIVFNILEDAEIVRNVNSYPDGFVFKTII